LCNSIRGFEHRCSLDAGDDLNRHAPGHFSVYWASTGECSIRSVRRKRNVSQRHEQRIRGPFDRCGGPRIGQPESSFIEQRFADRLIGYEHRELLSNERKIRSQSAKLGPRHVCQETPSRAAPDKGAHHAQEASVAR